MPFKDNRQLIEALTKTGDVVRIKKEVDWDLEAGAICRRTSETRAPAPFFEKIKDYPASHRIFGEPLATERRLAVALGMPIDTSYKGIRNEYERRLEKPIKPVVVKDAPCKENIIMGDKVDLFDLPAPMVHGGDGGRYIGTWHALICRDEARDWTNWGMYRLMILNEKHLVGLFEPYTHQYQIYMRNYGSKGKNMPIAIAIGMDPICSMMAASRSFGTQSEADLAGAVHQEPVQLIKCQTNDLLVPATTEIVLEGEVLTGQSAIEGPFGEYTGYRSDPRGPRRLYRINCITHRNNPILTMTCMGTPVTSDTLVRSMDYEMLIKRLLRRSRVPFVDVHVPLDSATLMAVVSVKPAYKGIAAHVGYVLSAGQMATYNTIVVEDDVDPFNMTEVIHALASKCHPIRGIKQFPEVVEPSALNPMLSPEERKRLISARAVFDCTWPPEWEGKVPPRSAFKEMYPKETQEKVIKNWASYGFK